MKKTSLVGTPYGGQASFVTSFCQNSPAAILAPDNRPVAKGLFVGMFEVRNRKTGTPALLYRVAHRLKERTHVTALQKVLHKGMKVTIVVQNGREETPFVFEAWLEYCSRRFIHLRIRKSATTGHQDLAS